MMVQEPADSPRRWCYGCGEANPEGLQIQFRLEGKRAVGSFRVRPLHQGFPGLAHGGITAAALDEAMGWAMYAEGTWAVTAKMEVRYRKPLPLQEELTVWGEVTRERGRWLEAVAKIRARDGQILAEAKALFMRVPPERALQLEAFYQGRREQSAGD
jgi:acyl-coenzyme A thioesterase PaaI-like protein